MTELILTLAATFFLGWESHVLFEEICDEIRISKKEKEAK